MSDKKLMKRKIVVDKGYKEMLKSYSATDLKEVAKLWGMKGLSKLKKDELTDAIYEFVLNNLEESFCYFNLDHYAVINGLLKGENTFSTYPVAANELISLGLVLEGNLEGNMQVIMPNEIASRFVDFYNKYHENLTFNTIVKDYMELSIDLYGVIEVEDFVENLYNFNEQAIEKDILQAAVQYTASRTKNTILENDVLHYYRLGEFEKVLKDIKSKDEIQMKVIDHQMLQSYVKNGNSLWADAYKRMAGVLDKFFPHKDPVDQIDELLVMLAYNHGVSDYIQLFSKKEEDAKMEGIKEFADATITINNEIPHWELKGHAPMELSKHQKQMPIVKGDKIGRNDPCPCGSGKKYKKCCMNK
ncbi:hypothetical protein EZV73_24880 [Acidaminobacter sp. JC074]|nr:SEC-C metal-binding domain-containing protein [Acidaminobacter sp. JC074]MCH4890838.1 hypothetical protein [Acidaminobacter sp. JC074]